MITPFLSREDIERQTKILAAKISSDYKDKNLLLLGVMNGCFVFIADLCRHLQMPLKVDFIRVKSYAGTKSTGNVQLVSEPSRALIENSHVLIVEDIIDTGLTLNYIVDYIKNLNPASVEIITLLYKKSKAQTSHAVKYAGFEIEDLFVVGYGMDADEKYRNLDGVFVLQ